MARVSPPAPAGMSRTLRARRPVTNGRIISIQSQKSCSLLAFRSSPGQARKLRWQSCAQAWVMNRAISAPGKSRLHGREHVSRVGRKRHADHGKLALQLIHEQPGYPLIGPAERLVVDVA